MPRLPRLDVPGAIYHVICRGIERRDIFKDEKDKDFFLSRLGDILIDSSTCLYAFALIPNHFHILIRRGGAPIGKVMQRVLTGYAIHFNRRHKRVGHLFQNRYKAILCEEDTYFLELVRYIHLNPLRAGLAESVSTLKLYPYSGHAYIFGRQKADWYNPDSVLSFFGSDEKGARQKYLEFVLDGVARGRRADLSGGGLKRSLGYPKEYPKERLAYDERILGAGSFVEGILGGCLNDRSLVDKPDLSSLFSSTLKKFGLSEAELFGMTKTKDAVDARAYLALKMQKEFGLSPSEIARELFVTRSAASKMVKRGKGLELS